MHYVKKTEGARVRPLEQHSPDRIWAADSATLPFVPESYEGFGEI